LPLFEKEAYLLGLTSNYSVSPNMVVSAPKDEDELQHLLYTATRCDHPMAIRYPRGSGPGAHITAEMRDIPIGKAELVRSGRDVCIVAIGSAVAPAVSAADRLSSRGVQASVVNARFVKPLDEGLIIDQAIRTGRMVVVEENVQSGGLGSAILKELQPRYAAVKVACLSIPDEFVDHGPQESLRAKYRLDSDGIVESVLSAFPELACSTTVLGKSILRSE